MHTHADSRRVGTDGSLMDLADELTDRLLRSRVLTLNQSIDDEIAAILTAQLHLLEAEDPRRDIRLFINSPGGSVTAGLAIYDTMQFISCDVITIASGLAASMGQILLCAGAPGKRFAFPNASIMMHQGSAGFGGTAADIAIQAEYLATTKERMNELLSLHTGQDIETIERDSDRDNWFDAERAQSYGMVDHVVGDRLELDAILARLLTGADAQPGFAR